LDVLKRHYEKLILALFLLGLLGGSWLLLAGLRKTREEVAGYKAAFVKLQRPEKGQLIEPLKAEDFTALKALQDPALEWQVKSSLDAGDLMNPRRYMRCANPLCHNYIPYECEVCPFCKTPQGEKVEGVAPEGQDSDGDGIPDDYEKKYDFLNPNVASDAFQDEDGDWFTNLDEYKAHTKPDDPEDHPDLAVRLRYIRTVKKPLGIILMKIVRNGSDNSADWDIFLNVYEDGHWKTRIRRVGQEVGNYKILEAKYKTKLEDVKALGAKVAKDISEVVIQKVKSEKGDEEPIVLKRKEQTYERGVAVQFILLNDLYSWRKCKIFTVVEGDPFELEDSEGKKFHYIFKKVYNDKVIVVSKDFGEEEKEFDIGPLNPAKDFVQPRRIASPVIPGAVVEPGAGPGAMMPGGPGAAPGMMAPTMPGMMPRLRR